MRQKLRGKKVNFEAADDHGTKAEIDSSMMRIVESAHCNDDKPHKFHIEHEERC